LALPRCRRAGAAPAGASSAVACNPKRFGAYDQDAWAHGTHACMQAPDFGAEGAACSHADEGAPHPPPTWPLPGSASSTSRGPTADCGCCDSARIARKVCLRPQPTRALFEDGRASLGREKRQWAG
jgi:hypothetical protein